MPDVGTQTTKPKRAKNKEKENIIKIKKIKEPKTKEQYIKPKLLIIFDDDI
jgi:hypothetical protein